MKKRMVAALLAGSAVYAHAQSSVTLYGILDEGLLYNSNANGKHLIATQAGAEASERWGLKGAEDLGGGLRAIFTLESGFTSATGALLQGGDEFGRLAYVGLSDQYGTITLGRRYTVMTDFVGGLESGQDWAGAGTEFGAHPGDADNLDGTNRTNNLIHVYTAPFHGLIVGGDYGFGNQAGSVGKDRTWSLAAHYAMGPVVLAAGYMYVNTPNFAAFGDKPSSSTTGDNMSSIVITGYASANAQKVAAFGGSYTLGMMTAALVYTNSQFSGLGSVPVAGLNARELSYRGTATFNTGEVNLKFQVSPAVLLGLAYHYTRDSGVDTDPGAHYQQVNLGATYALSKASFLYTLAIHQWASGTNSTGAPAVASINGLTASSSRSQQMVMGGFVHKF